jgi:hypothetical protein
MQSGSDKAIEQMNGREMNGRVLTVNEARPMTPRSGDRRY